MAVIMRYLLDARYKTLHSLALSSQQLLTICERGLSDKLYTTTTQIQELLPFLETYQSPPFTKEESKLLSDLHTKLSHIIHLPEDVIAKIKEVEPTFNKLLNKMEAFEISDISTQQEDKNSILDLLHNLKIYLQVHILDLEGTAHSIVNEMKHIRDIIQELKDLPEDSLEGWAQENLVDLLLAIELFQQKDSISTSEILLQRVLDLEFSLQSDKKWYCKEIEDGLFVLLQTFLEAEDAISSEEPLFTTFRNSVISPLTEDMLTKLRNHAFHEDKLKLVADMVLFSYEVLLEEKGGSLASRCRFIDFFQLFSNAIQDLYSFFLKAS
jgi:hypothetical protein